VERAHAKYPDRLTILCIVAPEDIVRGYEQAGCLVFEDAVRAVRAVAALRRIDQLLEERPAQAMQAGALAQTLPPGPFGEAAARQVLERAGIPLAPARLVRSAGEAVAAARELGLPAAMKVSSPDVAHKTEAGGVRLGIASESDAAAAFESILADVARRHCGARVDGVLVSPMITDGVETLIGIQRDAVFGPVVVLGMGGVLVEILDDVSMRIAPFDEREAEAMARELRGWPVLAGARGRGPFDLDALYAALARLSRFAADNADNIESVDINPFVVLPAGRGAMALDALIVTSRNSCSAD
ncbi:MAG: acetate--CoA ligase family protein, partial [Gammaproteobacteria bacterium]|nr:acetate--CoA ligase family protein [Gammaproteobacteria bacterium]